MAIPRSQSEILALENFRAVAKDLELGDGVLMRFLRARNLDQKKAEEMIRKFVLWREHNEVNQFQNWIPLKEFYAYDAYFTGFEDYDGRAVFWAPFGHWPYARDLLDKGLEKDILLFAGKCMDQVYKLLLRTKHQQFIAIVDIEGLTFMKMFYEARNWRSFEILMKLLRDYEANFPELLHKAFMINTPMAFLWGWKFLKPFFSDYTLSKVNFYGSSASETEKWRSDLFNNLPEHVIPEKYGGVASNLVLLTDDNLEFTQF